MAAARVPTFHRSHTLPDHRSINPSRSASGLRDLRTQRVTELPSWSKATGVSSCMGRVNKESLGLADCPGPQAGICFFPSSSESAYSSSRQPLSRGERGDEGGDRESPPQRSSGEGGPNPGHILPHPFGPQTRRRLAPSYKPQAFEQFSESRAFQDGKSDVSARPPPEWRSHGQCRFKGCVPDGTHPPSGQEVPPLQLGTGGLPVSLPPLWSGVCASNLHQAPQTIVSPAEVTGPQNGWCTEREINPILPPIEKVLEFLTAQFKSGLQYSTLNSYRSSLSATIPPIEGSPVGQHPLVVRLMQGIFNSRPHNQNTLRFGRYH